MSKKGFRCHKCGSEFCSAIIWWKPTGQMKESSIDAFLCHDCNTGWKAGTIQEIDDDYEPDIVFAPKKRRISAGQADIFGNILNIEETIKPRPKMVRSPDGKWLGVYTIPEDKQGIYQYEKTCKKMLTEIARYKSKYEAPPWFKYRTISRSNERVEVEHVKGHLGRDEAEQWLAVEMMYADKKEVKIKDTGYFYQVSYKKE